LQKYETTVSMCLRGLGVFVESYIATVVKQVTATGGGETSLEKLDNLLMNPKFWKLSSNISTKVNFPFFLTLK